MEQPGRSVLWHPALVPFGRHKPPEAAWTVQLFWLLNAVLCLNAQFLTAPRASEQRKDCRAWADARRVAIHQVGSWM